MSLRRAELLLDTGRRAEAGALLSLMVAENPDDPGAWTLLGRAHLENGHAEAALSALDEAVRLAPDEHLILYLRGYALGLLDRDAEAEESLRAAIRVAPHAGITYAVLSQLLRGRPGRGPEAYELAVEAVRREPELAEAHLAVCLAAAVLGDDRTCEQALRETLRLDPGHEAALTMNTMIRAGRTTPGRATTLISDTLAANPHLTSLVPQLDQASYRLLRGMRALALVCLLLAGVVTDLFPTEGERAATLPVDLPERFWAVAVMGVTWGLTAVVRFRRLRTGARLRVRTLVRRGRWSRVVAAQTLLLMLGALVIVLPPWTDRSLPEAAFLIGLVPTMATILFDRKRRP